MSVAERLADLGFKYKPIVESSDAPFREARATKDGTVYVSGQVPVLGGGEKGIRGALGRDLTLTQARRAARIATFHCFGAVGTVADPDAIEQVYCVDGVVSAVGSGADVEKDVGLAMDAASEMLKYVLGERGEHARTAIGGVVPDGWAVDIKMILQVEASALH